MEASLFFCAAPQTDLIYVTFHLHSESQFFQILNTPIIMDVPDELFDVGIDNTSNVLDSVAKFSSVKEFMHADLFVGLHSTTVSYPHNFLEYMSS